MVRSLVAALLLAGIVLSATGHVDRLLGACGLARLNQSNDCYLKDSFDRSLKGFLVLSAIKSGIAVLEGSEVGVGFNLEVGDMVQSIYDYVDVAWRTALAGGTILLLMRIVLQVIQSVDHWLLVGSLSLYLIVFLSTECTSRLGGAIQQILWGETSFERTRIKRFTRKRIDSGFHYHALDTCPANLHNCWLIHKICQNDSSRYSRYQICSRA